ncbi:hypothetical protein [Symbiopectobacterium sp.]|uniref:hypothetical protein n=1 Tax=Symbiopectobacterium sp. TaxID=2952789 RepID=UPI003F6874BB
MLYQFIEYTTRHHCWQRPAHPASACSNRWRTPQSIPMGSDRLLLEIHNVLHAETVVGILCHRLLLMDHAQRQQQRLVGKTIQTAFAQRKMRRGINVRTRLGYKGKLLGKKNILLNRIQRVTRHAGKRAKDRDRFCYAVRQVYPFLATQGADYLV